MIIMFDDACYPLNDVLCVISVSSFPTKVNVTKHVKVSSILSLIVINRTWIFFGSRSLGSTT